MQTIQPGYEPRTDPRRLRAHGLRNRLQTVVLLIGMAVVVGIRKDVAAFALIAGTLTIALTM